MARRLGQLPRARFADARASALAESFSTVTLRIAEATAGLVVTLDDRPMPEVAWRTAIPIDAGHHTIGATAPKRRAWQATFDVDPAVPAAKVVIEVPPLEALPGASAGQGRADAAHRDASSAGPDAARARMGRARARRRLARGGLRLRADGEIEERRGVLALQRGRLRRGRRRAHRSSADPRRRVDRFFASAGALLVAGIVLFVTAPRGGSATRSTPALAVW